MSPAELAHPAFLGAALWTAALGYRGARPFRFLAALALGALCTRLGWALLHGPELALDAATLLAPGAGYCVLFLPVGPLVLARESAAWRALPLAVAVARTGCLVGGCCGGVETAWGRAPTALTEVALLLGLHRAVCGVPDPRRAGVFLLGFGLVRVLVEPWRAAPPLGDPSVPPTLLALGWAASGALSLAPRRTRPLAGLAALVLVALCWENVRPDVRPASELPVRPRHPDPGHPLPREAERTPPRTPDAARLGTPDEPPRRSRAAGGSPLASPDPRVRADALEANAEAWDAAALPLLIRLEEDPDPRLREQARGLVRRYLIWGPTPPTWRQRREANRRDFEPWDRAGLRAWRDRGRARAGRASPRRLLRH